jgi:c-di-GMP-related signal transduction protein
METLIARQPIFNQHKRIYAYELLYRGADALSLAQVGGSRATSSLLTSSYLTEGLEKISNNKPCFINFTEELLLKDIAANFPNNKIVVEILEDVPPTPEVVAACRQLKNDGYVLALDDFVFARNLKPLIELADIIKFDFLLTPIEEIREALGKLAGYDIVFLAEKVETHAEFAQALEMGFSYFQGYFFAKPEAIRIKEMAGSKLTILQLLAEINSQEIMIDRVTAIIAGDVALSYKLLRYINSAYFGLANKVESIPRAVTMLGLNEVRRFVTLAAISEISTAKPTELVRLAAIRAKFCEQLGTASPLGGNPQELFLLGLLSLLEAMLDTPISAVLDRLPLSDPVRQALTDGSGELACFLKAVLAYEKQEGSDCVGSLAALQIPEAEAFPLYLNALEYADAFVNL